MDIGWWVILIFPLAMAALLFGDVPFDWVMRRIVWPGARSFTVPKNDAEALLGRSHNGWRLWGLRLSACGVVLILGWALLQKFQRRNERTPSEMVDKAIDAGASMAESKIPANDPNSEKIKTVLRKSAEHARDFRKPPQPR